MKVLIEMVSLAIPGITQEELSIELLSLPRNSNLVLLTYRQKSQRNISLYNRNEEAQRAQPANIFDHSKFFTM